MKSFYLKSLFLCCILSVFFVSGLKGTNNWTLYQSYSGISEIEPSGKEVFVLSANTLFSYNMVDGSIQTLNKNNLLSDIDVSHICWCKGAKRLVIVYKNSNIDLLSLDGSVVNIPDLYLKNTTLDKKVNDIYLYGKIAYLSTQYGILKIDVNDGFVLDSYQLDVPVDYCYVDKGEIFAASPTEGLLSASLKSNLLNKKNWNKVGEYTKRNVDRKNVFDSANNVWWTVNAEGKLTYYRMENNERKYLSEGILPDGPASNNFYRIYLDNGKLYGLSGIWNQEIDGGRPGEVHVWDGEKWSEFEVPAADQIKTRYRDLLCMDFDPKDRDHVMVGAKDGMYEFRNGKFIAQYNKDNSNLCSASGKYTYTIISSVKYDETGKLWMLNALIDDNIKSFSPETNEWGVYPQKSLKGNNYDLERLFISKKTGKMWFVNNFYENTILFSYDYKNDILESYGPALRNQDGAKIDAHYIFSPVEDKDGNIWIGTDVGILYLPYLAEDKTFIQHKVPRNDGTNYADYLMADLNIRAIAVDGGNRKWIGTNGNGVYLISDDNNTQIYNFTTENSPLLSNNIQDIKIDGKSGTVYFATENGLCSFNSDATEPNEKMDNDNVYAYPNPVTPDYNGLINIVGLTYNSSIIITTANGTVVNRGKSNGGTYTWDGRDMKGNRVASGVYMVHAATSDGQKGAVCKIAIIK